MSKGHYTKKKNRKVPVWLILVVLAILAAAAILFFGSDSEETPSEAEGETTVQTETQEQADNQTETQEQTNSQQPDTETEETLKPTETQAPQVIVPQPTVVIIQKADAEYEKWLSAALVVCVSMEYPDFELEGVYAASATTLEDKFTSAGAYIVFTSGGSRMAIHAKALEEERTTAGTVDISTETIGYATFDQVDPASLDFSSMEQIPLEDLSELIAQSLLVSIYTR